MIERIENGTAGAASVSTGYLFARDAWGRGYATEGARSCLRYAFEQLKQPYLLSLIDPRNAASIRVAQRLGEQLQGQTEVLGKRPLVYRMTREEWEAANANPR